MEFSGAFVQPFQPAFDRGGAAVTPWYRAGGAPVPIAVYQPKGAASLAASYVNLANPGTYDAAPGVAPTFDAVNGWTGNALNMYLTTGITPALGRQTWAVVCRFTNNTANTAIFGMNSPSGAMHIFPNFGGTRYYRHGNSTGLSISGSYASAIMGFAGDTAYLNGAPEAGIIPGIIETSQPFYLLAMFNGGPTFYTGGSMQAIAIWNASTNHALWMPAVSAAVALI